MAIDTGYVERAVAIASELYERCGVELGGHRGVYGNAQARTQVEIAISVLGDELACTGALGRRHTAPSGP
jgi:hypothetical protein